MNTRGLLHGLRFLDSFFPSGGYAFSAGLESAVHSGVVTTAATLSLYVMELLTQELGPRDGVATGLAHEALGSSRLVELLHVDQTLDAMMLSQEMRTASRQMGRQILRGATMSVIAVPTLVQYTDAVEADRTPGHLAVSLGLTLMASGWSKTDAIAGYLYHAATGYVAAAMKLFPLGHREAQQVLEGWFPVIEQVSQQASGQEVLCAWSPVQDIYAMRHRQLTSRLFRS